MKRLLTLLLLSVTGMACVRNRAGAVESQLKRDCPRAPEADAVIIDSVPLDRLAGRSRLILIHTVSPQLPASMVTVDLQPPDSAFIAMLDNDKRAIVRVEPSERVRRGPPLVERRPGWATRLADKFGMSVGECIVGMCSDSSPTYYVFEYLSPTVVRGVWWNNMTGIGVMVDPKTNRRLPAPGGYFCMLRE